jgi:Family of unknown function (DUF6111)
MLRLVLENILLFLAPAALYVGYEMLLRNTATKPRQILDQAPLVVLFLAGLAVVITTLVLFRSREEGNAGQAYVPPAYKDGKIVPGHVQ